MSHLVIEHSSNLRGQLNLPRFVEAMRLATLATGIFPIGAMRTRAYESDPDCDLQPRHADHTFVHLCIRVGQDRDHATRRQACEEIFAAACEQLREVHARAPVGISVEMQKDDPDTAVGPANIRDYVVRTAR
ncbi:MAG: hypothetical protein WDM77_17435 [Steroidobacteraceae bacterium]